MNGVLELPKVRSNSPSSILEEAVSYLQDRQVPEPQASAEFLLAYVMGSSRVEIKSDLSGPVSVAQKRSFFSLIEKRAQRKPLAHLIGSQPFFDLQMTCDPGALIPRPETEELVFETEKLLKGRENEKLSFLEIGTGTGAISLALAHHFLKSRVMAMEKSARARRVTEKNLAAYPAFAQRVNVIAADLFDDWDFKENSFDLLISNPPYIPTGLINALEPEVLKEPHLALDGGPDGLKCLSVIIGRASRYLKPGGILALEIGADQGLSVKKLVKNSGLKSPKILRDLSGFDRFIFAAKDETVLRETV